MPIAYIALGSNLGNRTEALSSSIRHLGNLGRIVALSSLYETEPVDYHDQPAFLNAVVALETHLEPLSLLRALWLSNASWDAIGAKVPRRVRVPWISTCC